MGKKPTRHTARKRAPLTPRRIQMLAFPGAQSLDVMGPMEVFATTSRVLGAPQPARASKPAYLTEIVARRTGRVAFSSGIEIVATRSITEDPGPVDTLLVAGGDGAHEALKDASLVGWIRESATRVRRLASVCSGAFLLAEAGLLDGRRVTTHWQLCELLARRYPALTVDPDPIFVRDGGIYTSAGVTSGMDLALALVEEDHGRDVALAVARQLVLFLKRPGGQSQFSVQLGSQLADREGLRDLQRYIAENPGDNLSVAALASRSAMSPRNFARVFTSEVGTTPARFVERSRVEVARRRLEESPGGMEAIAGDCGFGSAETMRRAFLRNLGVGPADYRDRFRVAGAYD
jgi:transcriptional regulator GlxA family with amidase domain